MSLTYTIDHAGGFLRVAADGVVSVDELAAQVETVQGDERARRCEASLFDLRQARPAIGYAELVTFRDYLAGMITGRRQRWALLVCSGVSYGLARMFATLSEDLPLEIEIFEEENLALEWLGKDDRKPSDRLTVEV